MTRQLLACAIYCGHWFSAHQKMNTKSQKEGVCLFFLLLTLYVISYAKLVLVLFHPSLSSFVF